MRFAECENPKTGNLEWLIRKDGCMHCADPGCLKACPSPGAIVQYANGIVDFQKENCIGCGYCVTGARSTCRASPRATNKAYKCTLCSDRVAVGQIPACVKACPTGAIAFGTKAEMNDSRGEAHRGPQDARLRQGGPVRSAGRRRHARHVRAAPCRPAGDLRGLAQNPRISPMVELWKGAAKYAGLAVLGLSVVAGAVHHLLAGANRVRRRG